MNAHSTPPPWHRFRPISVIGPCSAIAILIAFVGWSSGRAFARPLLPCELADEGQEVMLLRNVYMHLSVADHDYKGHRVGAMKVVAAAGDSLGVNLRGDADAHETQASSDDQLKTAEALIEQAQQIAQGGGQGKVLSHLGKAIQEINKALSFK